MRIFLDTSFLVAFYNTRDQHHNQARTFIAETDRDISFVISDYIFDEILTVLLVRGGKFLSIEVGQLIVDDDRIDLLSINEQVFQKAWLVYHRFQDKEWSFTDCTSYVLMKNLSIMTGASFDEHFKQFGFRTVP